MSVSHWIELALNISIKIEHICYAPTCIGQPMAVFCIHVTCQTEAVFGPCASCRNMNQEKGKFCKLTAPVGRRSSQSGWGENGIIFTLQY